jgi:UDP-N-acetylmuramyl pentapeptide phosphotransferase/UDP-N-acetylglucosamine-1-phosphate transferase
VKARLLGSLVLGAIAATIVVIYDDTANHAALVAGAARNHKTVVSSLAGGFAGVTLFVALLVFVAGTVFAGRRRREGRRVERQDSLQRHRRRADAWR